MTKLLILEGQSPEISKTVHERGGEIGSDMFMRTFKELDPNLEFEVRLPYAGDFDAAILHDVDGVVLTGSSVPWSVDDPQARDLQNATHAAFNSTLPIWGSCNGLQMAVFLLGGEIGASPNGFELGLAKNLKQSDEGAAHPMMAGRELNFAVPCLHRDEVQKLPEGAVILARNDHSPVQAMSYERNGVRFWGTQYHPEMRASNAAEALKNSQGIFSDENNEALDLERAEFDEEAAQRLGTTPTAMKTPVRALELKNWLQANFG